MSKALAELLFRDKFITQAQHNEALEAMKLGHNPVTFLIDKKHVAETKLLYFLSQKFGLPSINLAKYEVNPEIIKLVSVDMARRVQVIPIQASKGTCVVAICDPTNMAALESLKFVLKMNIEAVLTSHTAFFSAFDKHYGGSASVGSAIDSFKKDKKDLNEGGLQIELVHVHEVDMGSAEQDAPIIALVNGVLTEAIRRAASDIHIEPYEKRFRVRMRVDGVLYEVAEVPSDMKRAVIARVKIMARMDIAESRVPQDGRIKLKVGASEIDFRVNSMPTLFGEKIVLRSLNKSSLQLDLLKLGFEQGQLENFKRSIYSPNGMVLVTGPTGSGKTTTLYSALHDLNKISDNLSTAEDPVEYNLEGINQVEVHKEIGLTFPNILRSLLRQDPDVILVGEIRDYETAEVAIQAALTGHLVLSTLHTNDAASTVTRLMNMGIEPFLVVASLNAVVAQRLIRTICSACRQEQNVPKSKLVDLGFSQNDAEQLKVYRGKGCNQCGNTGYKGRLAIYEVLEFTQTLKEMVLRGENVIELKKAAVKNGMKTLRQSALTKVFEGKTTLEEALSLTMEN